MNNLIRKFRFHWLKCRFKHSSTLIYLKSKDRGLGLTTLLEIESLRKGVPILVKNQLVSHQMYLIGLGLAPSHTESYIYNNLVLVSGSNYRGFRFDEILVDNGCSDFDVDKFLKTLISWERLEVSSLIK